MDILMPQLGETVAEGTISVWAKAVGDSVQPGDVLFEIETDKSSMEITATVAGKLAAINVEKGKTVPVGTVVAVIAEAGTGAVPVFVQAWLQAHGFHDVHQPGRHGNTPLMEAAWRGESAIVQALLARGDEDSGASLKGTQEFSFAKKGGGFLQKERRRLLIRRTSAESEDAAPKKMARRAVVQAEQAVVQAPAAPRGPSSSQVDRSKTSWRWTA